MEQWMKASMATKHFQPTASGILWQVVNILGRYMYLDEVVLTNRKDKQVGVHIWLYVRVVAAGNRKPGRGYEAGVGVTVRVGGQVVTDGPGSVDSWGGARAS